MALVNYWCGVKFRFEISSTRIALVVLQRNIRKFLQLRNWPWWKLFQKIKPLLNASKAEDDMKLKEEEMKKVAEEFDKEVKLRKEYEEKNILLLKEKNGKNNGRHLTPSPIHYNPLRSLRRTHSDHKTHKNAPKMAAFILFTIFHNKSTTFIVNCSLSEFYFEHLD